MFVVLFHDKFTDCKIDVPFPIKIWFAVKVVVPIPPRDTDKVPDVVFDAFNAVKPAPEPTKLVADNVLVVLFHAKFWDCKIDVPFPIKILSAVNVVVPIPPRETDKVPAVIFDAFKVDKDEFNA